MLSLARLQHAPDGNTRFWEMPDSNVYFANAQALANGQPWCPMFRDRMVLPFLLYLTHSKPDNPYPFLYLQQILHFIMPLLLSAIAYSLFGKRWIIFLTVFLYLLYEPARIESRIVSTDFIHAFLFVSAVYWTLKYWERDKWIFMFAAAANWSLAMLSRPTFMWECLLVAPILGWKCWIDKASLPKSICYCILLTIVPLSLMYANFIRFGIATSSFASFENIHSSLVPSIQTLLRKEDGDPERTSVVFAQQVRQQKAMMNNAWATLELWHGKKPDSREHFAQTYTALQRFNRTYIMEHLGAFYKLVKLELGDLVFNSNKQWCLGNRGRTLFVWSALTGLLFLWHHRRRHREALWLFLNLGLLLIPASCAVQLWWGRRVGVPADLLFIALAGGSFVSWKHCLTLFILCGGFKALNLMVYAPAMNCAIIVVMALIVLALKPFFTKELGLGPLPRSGNTN